VPGALLFVSTRGGGGFDIYLGGVESGEARPIAEDATRGLLGPVFAPSLDACR
jgi:hypothetical protein